MDGVGVVVRYNVCPYVAFQFSKGTEIELGMWNNEDESRDANFTAEGPTYEVLLMYPIQKIHLTPYVGLGYTDLSCGIDYNNWWHYGWSSPDDYDRYGNGSTENRNGTSRWMTIEEPGSAITLSLGITAHVWRYAQLDVFYRTLDVDDAKLSFDRHAGHVSRHMRDGYVPLECSSWGVALRAVF